ncbi:MAG: hypothetical protein ABSC42_02440 [Tepidisphaeraceae bacterium]|jgi:hypothetical protein
MLNRRVAAWGFFACTLALAHWSSVRALTVSFDSADGHWYAPVLVPTGITWGAAQSAAVAQGGYLACPTSSAENSFVFSLIDTSPYWTALSVNSDFLGPWLGASASNDFNGSDATWVWVNGASFSYAPWGPNQPDGYPGNIPAQAIGYYDFASIGPTWGDTPQNGVAGFSLPQGYVIEFNQNPATAGSAVPLPSAAWSSLALLAGLAAIYTIKSRRAGTR